MSELLAQWLNERVCLSRPVANFEKDFANGYLLGELLYKLDLQADFNEFRNDFLPKSIVGNFNRASQTLQSIGVKFTSAMANEVMNGSPGAAVRVIHQIKLTEKRLAKAQEAKGVKVSRLPAIGGAAPTVPIPPTADFRSRPQYETMERKVLTQRLTETVHAARRGDDMARHLHRFEATKAQHGAEAEAELQREKGLDADRKNMTRQMTIDQYKAGVASRKDAELRGTAQLTKHLDAVAQREQDQLRFELTEQERRRRAKLAKSTEARSEVEGGIDAFERTLQKMAGADGAPLNPSPEPADSARAQSPQPETAAEDGAAFLQSLAKRLPPRATMQQRAQQEMARIKQKTAVEQAARVERDRRRRKLLADEQALVDQHAQQQREHALARGDSRPASVAEREMEDDEWRVHQTAEMFVANATLVNRLVKDREEGDHVEALDRDRLAYEADKSSFDGELKAQTERAEEARAAKKRARHNDNVKYCRGVAQRIVDIAVKAATFRELSDSPLVPPKVWREWMTLFINDRSILPTEPAAPGANNEIEHWLNTSLQQLQDVNEDSAESLDDSMFGEYLATKGLWADKHFAAAPADPSDPVLGAVVDKLVRLSSGAEDRPEFPRVAPTPLGVCLLGKPFSGKRTQARVIAERFGLKVLRLSELIDEAVQAANELSPDAKAKAAKSKEPNGGLPLLAALGLKAVQFTSKGKPVPDELAVSLIGEAVRKVKAAASELRAAMEAAEAKGEPLAAPAGSGGWLLADFPQTDAQARLLEKELSGYEPPSAPASGVPKVTKNPKEKVQSKVAPPPAEPAAPSTTNEAPVPSGIDVVLRLTVDNEAATRRALGRRVDPVTNVEYHIDSNPPPEDQPIKARLLPPADNASLEAALPKLLTDFEDAAGLLSAWFAPFRTLVEVSGAESSDAVSRAVSDRLKDAVAAKEKQQADLKAAEEARAAEERGRREQEIKAEALAKEAVSTDVRAAEQAEEKAKADKEEAAAKAKEKGKPGDKRATGRSESPVTVGAAPASSPAPAAGPAPSDEPQRTPEELAADFGNFRKFTDKPLSQLLVDKWIAMERGYTDQFKKLFRVLRKERWSSLEHFAALRKGFLRFLQRPHDNNALVQAFQAEFNAIDSDLRKDIDVKEELHQRADELGDKLWEATSHRKAEAQQLLRAAAQDGWLERHADQLVGHYSFMMQLELDRYAQSINTSRDFLTALSGLPIPDKQFPCVALPIAEIAASLPFGSAPSPPAAAGAKAPPKSAKKGGPAAAPASTGDEPAWKHCAFVVDTATERLKQLAQKAKDTLIPPTVSEAPSEPVESKSKAAPKDPKAKDPKAKKEAVPAVTLQCLPDPHCQAQLIALLNKQNEILIRRVESVLRCALDSVEELRQYTEQEERKLDQWMSLRIKGESSAIDSLLRAIKDSIEKALPLYYPLKLEGEDLLIERHFLSTPLPLKASSPVALPPQGHYHLSWDQLNNLHAYLKTVAPDGFITNSALVGLLMRMAAHSTGNALVSGPGGRAFSPLPPRWCTLDRRDLDRIAAPFDSTGSHRISWRALLMALALPSSVPTPTLHQLSSWQAAFKTVCPSEDRRIALAQLPGHPLTEAVPEGARWTEFVFGVLAEPSDPSGPLSLDYGRLLAHLCFTDDQLTGQQKLNHVLPDHVTVAAELLLSRVLVTLPN